MYNTYPYKYIVVTHETETQMKEKVPRTFFFFLFHGERRKGKRRKSFSTSRDAVESLREREEDLEGGNCDVGQEKNIMRHPV